MNPLETLPPRFINWALSPDGVKIPVDENGRTINAMVHSNWKTLDAASASKFPLAFVICAQDNLFFFDLDKCLQPDGNWSTEATQIFQSFPGAMFEVSQSGKGLHIIGKCNPLVLTDRKNRWDGWKELYVKERFVAFGPHGWDWIGEADPDRDHTHTLRHIAPQREWIADGTGASGERDPAWSGPEDDDELLARMLASTGGAMGAFGAKATFKQLWEADDLLANFYPSEDDRPDKLMWDRSKADMALTLQLAFWTGKDWNRMDRLFRRSALMRPKWDRKDYRSKTISDAVQMTNNVYAETSKTPAAEATAAIVGSDTFMTISEQIEYFKGCVYVRDVNKMFMPDGALVNDRSFSSQMGGYIFQIDPANNGAQARTKSAFEAFTLNRGHKFPKCHNTFFDPAQPTGVIMDERVNTWVKPTVVTAAGDVTPFLDLLGRMMPVETDRAIILNYMASMVQNPGVKFRWAPVIQGTQGNGKTFLADCLAYAVGESVTHRPEANNLTEKFNSFLERNLLIVVEEIHMSDKREVLETLKPWLTNNSIEVRQMQTDKRMVRNFANFFFLTNHQDAVAATRSERRYSIFYTAQQTAQDLLDCGMTGDYWSNLYDWFHDTGKHIVAGFLQNFTIDPALDPAGVCNRAPETSSTSDALKLSYGRIESEIIEAIETEMPGFCGGWISSVKLADLFQARGISLGRNKWSSLLQGLGFWECDKLQRGRSTSAIFQEGNKKPKLYCNYSFENDPVQEYCEKQGYNVTLGPPKVT